MERLTDLAIQALPAEESEYTKRDVIPGFGVRVRPSGHKSFVFIYDFHGRRRKLVYGEYNPKGGLNLAAARRLHARAARLLAEGVDPGEHKQEAKAADVRARAEAERHPTMASLAKQYLDLHAKPKKRSWKEDERILTAEVLPVWGGRKARDISRAEVNQLLDGVAARGGVMANRTLALIRKVFNFAIARDLLGNQANPATLVERRVEEESRRRVLSEAEIRDFWDGPFSESMAVRTVLALKTILASGQRPGEVANIEWTEIDGDWWTIPPAKSKNGLAHRVYLTPVVKELLAQARSQATSSRWVFAGAREGDKPITVAALSQAVRKSQPNRAINERWTPHDLRRSCATNLGKLGVSRFIQDKVLNHKDRSIGAVYDQHEYDAEKQFALQKWAARLAVILGQGDDSAKVIPFPNLQGSGQAA